MDFMTSRALQISLLSERQIKGLHERENLRHYCIPNWNIQSCFNLPTIKESYGIPADDNSAQEAYSAKIRKQLEDAKMFLVESDDRIGELSVDATHSFDWNVWNKKGNFDFSCTGGRVSRLKQAVRSGMGDE